MDRYSTRKNLGERREETGREAEKRLGFESGNLKGGFWRRPGKENHTISGQETLKRKKSQTEPLDCQREKKAEQRTSFLEGKKKGGAEILKTSCSHHKRTVSQSASDRNEPEVEASSEEVGRKNINRAILPFS